MTTNIPLLLTHYLDGIAGAQPFDWPSHNCGHFAFNWWRAATGADVLAGLAMPATAAACAGWLVQHGGSLAALVTQRTGCTRIHPHLAQVGDVVIIGRGYATAANAVGLGAALGICTGRLAALLGSDGRVVFAPMVGVSSTFSLRGPA